MASKLSSQLVPLISSGQSAKRHQMVSAHAEGLLRYPDWAYLNEEVWDKISIILRLAQQRFSCLIGQILLRIIRDTRDYKNITFYRIIWQMERTRRDPKPPLRYIMSKKMHLILNDQRFSQTGCDKKMTNIYHFWYIVSKKDKLWLLC